MNGNCACFFKNKHVVLKFQLCDILKENIVFEMIVFHIYVLCYACTSSFR